MIQRFVDTWNKYRHEVRAEIVKRPSVDAESIAELVLIMLMKHKNEAGLAWHTGYAGIEAYGDTRTVLFDTSDEDDITACYVARFSVKSELLARIKLLEDTSVADFKKQDLDVCMEFARRVVCGLQEVQTLREPGYVIRKEDTSIGHQFARYATRDVAGYTLRRANAMVFVTFAEAAARLTGAWYTGGIVDTEGCDEVLR